MLLINLTHVIENRTQELNNSKKRNTINNHHTDRNRMLAMMIYEITYTIFF